eukprot:4282119-Heterocapsa_arctica.AAC.1
MVDVGNFFDLSFQFQVNTLLFADVEMTLQQHPGYDICKIVDDTNSLANNELVFTYRGKPVRTGPRTVRLTTGVLPAMIAKFLMISFAGQGQSNSPSKIYMSST